MVGLTAPDLERWSARVVVARGKNPGPFTGPGTNTYLIGTGGRPLLLDTGSGVPAYLPVLEAGLAECGATEPGDLVVTHTHPDHLGGAAQVCERFGPRPVQKTPWPGRDQVFPVEIMPLEDGAVVEAEGARLRAIYTPGHAQDHLCFYLEEERALFTGDVILGVGTTVIPLDGGDMRLYLDTLERLSRLDLERIYPGHGPMIERPKEKIREYIDHRLEREQQILDAMAAGDASIERMVERIYTDTPRILYPAAGMSVRSHLLKLEAEKRAGRSVGAAGEERWSLA
jgi:glyoxylase-like metal-dependent hydrolase (beta-lactamase superfamily II)